MRRPTECGHVIFHRSCAECKALEAVYYKKLSDSGFVEIENTKRADRMLKVWHSFRFGQPLVESKRKKLPQEYYERAQELLFTYQFKKPIHKLIWEMHSDGHSERQIESVVAKSDFEWKLTRIGIHFVIKRIAMEIKF